MAQTIIVPWHLASLSCYSKSMISVYFTLGQPSRFILKKIVFLSVKIQGSHHHKLWEATCQVLSGPEPWLGACILGLCLHQEVKGAAP